MKTLLEFLRKKGFVVLTGHTDGAEYEAWAYEGPLDLETAVPQRFGIGDTPVAALEALDWQLEKATEYQAAPLAATPAPPLTPPTLNRRELATVLAALRYHQDENLQAGPEIAALAIRDIATDGGTLRPLSAAEIDALCQKLNVSLIPPNGLHVDPPPAEPGDEPLHRVVYLIDVNAKDPRDAAEQASEIMSDPNSLPPILHVIDRRGHTNTIDLAKSQT
jgi:hypothetical protein